MIDSIVLVTTYISSVVHAVPYGGHGAISMSLITSALNRQNRQMPNFSSFRRDSMLAPSATTLGQAVTTHVNQPFFYPLLRTLVASYWAPKYGYNSARKGFEKRRFRSTVIRLRPDRGTHKALSSRPRWSLVPACAFFACHCNMGTSQSDNWTAGKAGIEPGGLFWQLPTSPGHLRCHNSYSFM